MRVTKITSATSANNIESVLMCFPMKDLAKLAAKTGVTVGKGRKSKALYVGALSLAQVKLNLAVSV